MVFLFFFIILFNLNEEFLKFEKRLIKIEKANNYYELKINIEFYSKQFEDIKKNKKIEDLERLKKELEYNFYNTLKQKYFFAIKKIEENKFFLKPTNIEKFEEHKKFLEEIDMRIITEDIIEDLNNEILSKIVDIEKSFTDPCPELFQKAESSDKLHIKIENYCLISKSVCLFSEDLKEFAKNKLNEEKENFIKNIEKFNFKDLKFIYNSIYNCYKDNATFNESIEKISEKILNEIKISLEKKNLDLLKKNLDILNAIDKEEKIKNLKENFIQNIEIFCAEDKDTKEVQDYVISLFPELEKQIIQKCPVKEKVKKEEKVSKENEIEPDNPYIILDIWQSAWKDFKDIDLLIEYIKNNEISEINLNIGKEITEKIETKNKAKEILKEIVPKLYEAGIKNVNLLYAELNYPIENYAKFISENPDLKIYKIVDDSEFTDKDITKYKINSNAVNKFNLKYSVFVTLEKEGNSGVSDKTRFFLIKETNEVILMSYFSCDLEEQKRWLFPYLSYSDQIGKKNNIKVAILFGGKSVGREVSCDFLKGESLNKFIFELHKWLASNFNSYSGIVIETNKKLPPNLFFKNP